MQLPGRPISIGYREEGDSQKQKTTLSIVCSRWLIIEEIDPCPSRTQVEDERHRTSQRLQRNYVDVKEKTVSKGRRKSNLQSEYSKMHRRRPRPIPNRSQRRKRLEMNRKCVRSWVNLPPGRLAARSAWVTIAAATTTSVTTTVGSLRRSSTSISTTV